jgi:hypothetical protein
MKRSEYIVAQSRADKSVYFSRYQGFPGVYHTGISNAWPFRSKSEGFRILIMHGEDVSNWKLIPHKFEDIKEIE